MGQGSVQQSRQCRGNGVRTQAVHGAHALALAGACRQALHAQEHFSKIVGIANYLSCKESA
jgi:hypothetical protein